MPIVEFILIEWFPESRYINGDVIGKAILAFYVCIFSER